LITTTNQVFWLPTNDGSLSRNYTISKGENNGTSLWTWSIIRNVLDWGVWKIYGQVVLLNFSLADNNSTVSGKKTPYKKSIEL
jgi:hypothetical protein